MAIKYVNHSIGTEPKYGKGHGPINHLSTININKNLDEKCSCCWISVG